jgi:hypothetical protein
MKKIILLFCFAFLSSNSFGQMLFEENFDYLEGDSIGAHGWIWNTGVTNTILVTSPGLTYPGYPLSGIGNATTLNNNGNDAYKNLNQIDSIGSVYASFMVRVDAAVAQGDYFLALLQAGSTSFYEGRVSARLRDGNLNFGITKGNAGSDTNVAGIWTTDSYSLGTTYLVVLKYTFIPGPNNDAVSLFVFTSGMPATEPTPTVGPISAYTSPDANGGIGRIALRQGAANRAPTCVVDGIRVTSTWMPSVWNIRLAVQGIYNEGTGRLNLRDTVDIYLRSVSSPYAIIDSAKSVIDSVTLTGKYVFSNAPNGNYYLEVKYRNLPVFRNGIRTWSKAGGQSLSRFNGSYDFTTASSQAFGNNMRLKGSIYTIFNGDANQDDIVDLTDLVATANDASSFVTGYVNTDMNGDNTVDLADVLFVFNNSASFVEAVIPAP